MARIDLVGKPEPILGVLLISGGWFAAHQVGSDGIYDQCARGGPFVVVVSVIGLLVIAAGGLYCLLACRGGGGPGRRFFGRFGALFALAVGFATLLQVIAGLIVPACAV